MEYKNYLIDMDGVLIRGTELIPGANQFLDSLVNAGRNYLILTNNPIYTPADLSFRLRTIGLEVPEGKIFTSSMAVAQFLNKQKPHGKAFVIGESGLTSPIHYVGYIITDLEPDYVVLGETFAYNLDLVTKAIRLIANGARFIATNPDVSDVTVNGIVPACGAMAALIEKTTGVSPFFVGKPNPLMMRMALNYINAHSEETVMVGDRMDTDIVAGLTSGMETILVLSGVTQRSNILRFPYQPTHIRESVKDILF
jgi:NagD protein